MRRGFGRSAWLLGAMAAAFPGAGRTADGALEINQACVSTGCFTGDTAGYPITISQPGRYLLTSNLLATAANVTAITIAASPVELDLGGFTIDGGSTCIGNPVGSCTGSTSMRGIAVTGSNRVSRIRNGSVKGFDVGIDVGSALDGSVLEDLTVSDNRDVGIAVTAPAPNALVVRRVAASRNYNLGLSAGAGRLVIRDSLFSGNGTGADTGSAKTVFLDNQFIFNFFRGVRCQGVGSVCVLGRNVFLDNNDASTTDEYSVLTLRDMGGNVCDDGACP